VIEVRNLVVKKHVPFKEYLVTPGHSFSSIAHMNRVKPFEITKKIKFGSQVDSYLFTPKEFKLDADFKMQQIRRCANSIRDMLGDVYKCLEFQLSISADFIYEGFKLHYKGRPDAVIRKAIIVDLKLTEGINPNYNYPAQLSGYAIADGCKSAFILAQHPHIDKCEIHKVEISHGFWERACLMYGEPI
jgi:hypothetical protein